MITYFFHILYTLKMKRLCIFIPFVILTLLNLSCNRQEPIPEFQKERSIRDIGLNQVPEIESLLAESLGLNEGMKENRFELNDGNELLSLEIDWSKIVELIDTLGNTNYSIAIKDEQNGPYIFHNLVVGKTPEGFLKRPYLMTYIMSDEFRAQYDNSQSIKGFQGTVKKRHLTINTGNTDGYSSSPFQLKSSIDSDPCDTETGISGDSPSGGGGEGLPTVNTDDTTFTYCISYWVDFDDDESCGMGCVTASRSILITECFDVSYSSSDSDPCDNSGEVAVIDPNKPCPGDPLPNMEIASSGASGKKGGTFGYTRSKGTQFHDGVDLMASPGTVFNSILPGKVIYIENTFKRNTYQRNSYGNYIVVRSTLSDGTIIDISYNHLNNTFVSLGDTVNSQTTLGTTGLTGNASSENTNGHLHVKARVIVKGVPLNRDDVRNNPALYISSTIHSDGSVTKKPCRT